MDQHQFQKELEALTLGRKTDYVSDYSAELLRAVPRKLNRDTLEFVVEQPFVGADVWHAYELSWLNSRGKPVVALGRFTFDANSQNIVESKSFKLYLNSYNQTRFECKTAVLGMLERDLGVCCGGDVSVELFSARDDKPFEITELPGICLDDIDIDVSKFELSERLLCLESEGHVVDEVLHSHLLKSNCLITNQPDWASIVIEYRGAKISHESLLRYLISFRMHSEFHEHCVERIFADIRRVCAPTDLSVQALYTRRGGLDINPYRTTLANSRSPVRRINRQ